MSHDISIGKLDGDGPLHLNIPRLIVSRALLTAASGGGKSWLLRVILEAVSATTQTIVIDPEGEFASLREARDMLLVGPGGELPADPRSAALLARRIMELNVSAVIDLSDLPLSNRHTHVDRRTFAANFLRAMIELPKELWRPCVVAIDEAHEFAPEGEAVDTSEPVALLASKGRKRGYCLLAATQRLQKLDKDVAAELKTRFVGQMVLDTDQKRAADLLGFPKARWTELRDLSPPGREGEFFAVGPALSERGVVKFRSAKVKTTHPKAGEGRMPEPPKPSKAIAAVLGELADLPKQAEAEIRDLAAAKSKIAELERAARQQQREAGATTPSPASKELQQQVRNAAATIAALRKGLADAMKVIAEINSKGFDGAGVDPEQIRKAVEAATDQIVKLVERKMTDKQAEFDRLKREAAKVLAALQRLLGEDVTVKVDVQHNRPFTVTPEPKPERRKGAPASASDLTGRHELTPTERAVLDAAASFPGGATRQRISIFSGRSNKSSSFKAAFSGGEGNGEQPSLVQRGLLRLVGDKYEPTDEGMAMAEPTAGSSLADWVRKLTPSEGKVLECIARADERLTRERVSELTGQSMASSSFKAAFPALRELGLIEGTKDYAATPELLDIVDA